MERRARVWIEFACAGSSALLAAITVVWPDWIEAVFHVDPDHADGSFEWLIVASLLTVALTLSTLAYRELRRPARAT